MFRRLLTTLLLPVLAIVSCSGQHRTASYAASLTDLNGTWIQVQPSGLNRNEILRTPGAYKLRQFSWGIGKSIPGTSYDFDLARKEFDNAPAGAYDIVGISKMGVSKVDLKVFDPGTLADLYTLQNGVWKIDESKLGGETLQQVIDKNSMNMSVDFVSYDKINVKSPEVFGGYSGLVTLERLSGPPRTERNSK